MENNAHETGSAAANTAAVQLETGHRENRCQGLESVQGSATVETYGFARQASASMCANRLDEAESLLKSGIKLHPDYATGYQILGDLYLAKKMDVSAAFAYFEALRRSPENPVIMLRLGDLYRGRGELQEARKYYTEALVFEPGSALLLGRLKDLAPISECEAEGDRALLQTETAADLYFEQGYRTKARLILRRLLRNDPTNERLKRKLLLCE